jgi:hypothetical protein
MNKTEYTREAIKLLEAIADAGDLDTMAYLAKNNIQEDKYLKKIYDISQDENTDILTQKEAAKRLFELTAKLDSNTTQRSYRKSFERAGSTKKTN